MSVNNTVRLTGNLTKDPVIRTTRNGKANAWFTLAVNDSYQDRNGETHEYTNFPPIIAWGKLAEDVGNILRKGMRVTVEGEIKTRTWDSEDGQRHYVLEIEAKKILQPIGYGRKGSSSGSGNFEQFGEQQPPQQQDDSPFPAAPPPTDEQIPF